MDTTVVHMGVVASAPPAVYSVEPVDISAVVSVPVETVVSVTVDAVASAGTVAGRPTTATVFPETVSVEAVSRNRNFTGIACSI